MNHVATTSKDRTRFTNDLEHALNILKYLYLIIYFEYLSCGGNFDSRPVFKWASLLRIDVSTIKKYSVLLNTLFLVGTPQGLTLVMLSVGDVWLVGDLGPTGDEHIMCFTRGMLTPLQGI